MQAPPPNAGHLAQSPHEGEGITSTTRPFSRGKLAHYSRARSHSLIHIPSPSHFHAHGLSRRSSFTALPHTHADSTPCRSICRWRRLRAEDIDGGAGESDGHIGEAREALAAYAHIISRMATRQARQRTRFQRRFRHSIITREPFLLAHAAFQHAERSTPPKKVDINASAHTTASASAAGRRAGQESDEIIRPMADERRASPPAYDDGYAADTDFLYLRSAPRAPVSRYLMMDY